MLPFSQGSAWRRRLKRARFRYTRFTHHFATTIKVGSGVFSALTFLAAIACLVSLVITVGYDHTRADMRIIWRALRACQTVFAVNVVFNLALRPRFTIRNSKAIKWIADIAVLISILPVIYPHPANPWIPWLKELLYAPAFTAIVLAFYAIVDLCFDLMRLIGRRTNPSLLLSGSFLFFIVLGSFLLLLPKCTTSPLSYIDSFFLATSAVCITGLTPVDIASTFTPTGLAILAVLIQIGGLGVLTFTSFFALFFSGSTSVYSQMLIRDLVYSKSMNSLGPTLLYILSFSLTIELIGAACVYITIPAELQLQHTDKLIFAAFHSLSAFCNAGFSCLPGGMANPALMTPGQGLYIVSSILIFAGAIGFPILVNFKDILLQRLRSLWYRISGRRASRQPHLYDLNTKLVLTTTLIILTLGSAAFFALEYYNTMAGLSLWQKTVQSVFNSLIPRSAGFASLDPSAFMPLTLLIIVVQMWIGGSSQSLAGGIKVNTVATVWLHVRSVLTSRQYASAWCRAISPASVSRATTVIILAAASFLILTGVLIGCEPTIPLKSLLFEATSALFTVGSSLGITSQLCFTSKVAICAAMFVGRVGVISILSGIAPAAHDNSRHLPQENVIIN